jgi:hypothetical protein
VSALFVVGQCQSSKEINAAFDGVLNDAMAKFGKTVDPYFVSDKQYGFKSRIAFVTFQAKAKLHNIVLDGVANIQRKGDAILTKNKTASVVTANLFLPVMFFNADSEISFMGLGPRRHLYGQLDDTTIKATIHYDPRIETVYLVDFKITKLANIRLKVDGPGLIRDAVSNLFIGNTVSLFQRVFHYLVEKVMSRTLTNVVTESEILKHIMTSL